MFSEILVLDGVTLAESTPTYALDITEDLNGKTVYVTSALMNDEARTASFTVKCSNLEGITLKNKNNPSYSPVLTENPQIVKFIPGIETDYTVTGENIWRVIKNGEDGHFSQTGRFDYEFSVDANDVITLELKGEEGTATQEPGETPDPNEPEEPAVEPADSYPVHFTFFDEQSKGYIESVLVNYEYVNNYMDADFTVPADAILTMNVNSSLQKESFTANGIELSVNPRLGSAEYVITEETTIYVKAGVPGNNVFTIKVDNPENVMVGYGSVLAPTPVALTGTETTVELAPNVTTISVQSQGDGVSIVDCTVDGVPASKGFRGSAYSITVRNGMVVEVTTHKAVRDQNLYLYMDEDIEMLMMMNSSYSSIFEYHGGAGNFVRGAYNHYLYSPEMDCPFNLSSYFTGQPSIYIVSVRK